MIPLLSRPLGRRTLLRGAGGVAIALPFLDAMAPRRAAAAGAAGKAPKRLVTFLIENGVVPNAWFPTGTEKQWTLAPICASLAPHQKNLIFVDGLDSKTQGGTCHSAARCGALTGQNNNGGRANGISIDQAVANAISAGSRLKSVEASVFLKGNLVYSLFHSGPGQMVVPIDDPAMLFARLFSEGVPSKTAMPGDPQAEATFQALRKRKQSILDHSLEEYKRVQGTVGASDKTRLDRHMAGIREIERTLAAMDPSATGGHAGGACALPTAPAAAAPDFQAHTKLQSELVTMALACDITRVGSIQTRASLTSFTWLGVNTGQHALSHQQGSPGADAQLNKIATWFTDQLRQHVIERLKSMPDSDGQTVFDNTIVFYTNDLGRGTHARQRYPFMLATGNFTLPGGGVLETGRYLKYPSGSPHNDLLASILKIMGGPSGKFGAYGTGPLPGLG